MQKYSVSYDGEMYPIEQFPYPEQVEAYVNAEVAEELLAACQWAVEQFNRLADEGRYPEFMLSQNGGQGVMPLIKAIERATNSLK